MRLARRQDHESPWREGIERLAAEKILREIDWLRKEFTVTRCAAVVEGTENSTCTVEVASQSKACK
jgi:hypothetical protein